MNTNSTQETQIVKLSEKECVFGNRNDRYALFTLPLGHVVYVVDKNEDGHWSWFEEHVDKTEVQMGQVYSKMIIYTEEGNKYTWEVDAFMTVQGADAACEAREIADMQQRDIEHMRKLLDEKEREVAMVELQNWVDKQTNPYD